MNTRISCRFGRLHNTIPNRKGRKEVRKATKLLVTFIGNYKHKGIVWYKSLLFAALQRDVSTGNVREVQTFSNALRIFLAEQK